MRLLNTITYELEEFSSAETAPEYAILSHCWGVGEVTFADIQDPIRARSKEGWKKVERACAVARERYGRTHIWIDTCCIDKSSSAELSEAICSMFAWYRRAEICLTYLHDVLPREVPEYEGSTFRSSRWFTRGWTLQELVAPTRMVFLSLSWDEIGCRADLAEILAQVTRVDARLLGATTTGTTGNLTWDLRQISVAKRMSWAAGRSTTRSEDRAYSLMGIFDVNIPIIYGEGGEKAFRRLQLEIIQDCPDQTLFAWGARTSAPLPERAFHDQTTSQWRHCPLLASSPDDFASCSDLASVPIGSIARVTRTSIGPVDLGVQEFHFYHTNLGIRISLPIRRIWASGGARIYCALLACEAGSGNGPYRAQPPRYVGLLLHQLNGGHGDIAAPLEYACLDTFITTPCSHNDRVRDNASDSHVDLPLLDPALPPLHSYRARLVALDDPGLYGRRMDLDKFGGLLKLHVVHSLKGWAMSTIYIRTGVEMSPKPGDRWYASRMSASDTSIEGISLKDRLIDRAVRFRGTHFAFPFALYYRYGDFDSAAHRVE